MQDRRQCAHLRILAVLLLVLGISSMHSPDLTHPAPAAASGVSMAMNNVATTDPPVDDAGSAPFHQRWVGACLAILGTLGAVLALCRPTPGSNPMDRISRHRSALLHRVVRAWSPPAPSIYRLCVMRR